MTTTLTNDLRCSIASVLTLRALATQLAEKCPAALSQLVADYQTSAPSGPDEGLGLMFSLHAARELEHTR